MVAFILRRVFVVRATYSFFRRKVTTKYIIKNQCDNSHQNTIEVQRCLYIAIIAFCYQSF